MKTITYADALNALNEAVKAKGYDYVYTKRGNFCYNVFDGNPDCIVGHALVWLGVPVEWFADSMLNENATTVCNTLNFRGMFDIEEDAIEFLSEVQVEQDSGTPWGKAVTRVHIGFKQYHVLALEAFAPIPS